MKRSVFIGLAVWLGISVSWGQSDGIMPKRGISSSSLSRLVEKRSNTPVEVLPDTVFGYESPEEIVEQVTTQERQLVFDETAISMSGFDKRMSDTKESFLLRNNTPYHLSRVVIKFVYSFPDGTMIDSRERVVECDLMPRATRRCEIPSFDTSRNYYHVDSPPTRTAGRPFKVSFQLLRYDVVVEPYNAF